MKVKICSHGPSHASWYVFGGVSINPAPIFLKTFYDIHGLNPNTEWLTPEVLLFDDIDTIVKQLLEEDVDILGLGVYIWNETVQMGVAKKIKELKPSIIVVAGGPQLSVHLTETAENNEENFFVTHPYIDYVVYGDGERAFQQIIDYETGFLKDKEKFVNIIEPDSNKKRIIYPLEILSDPEFLSTSAFATNRKMVIDILNRVTEKGARRNQIIWCVEFARGCMYSCTFCDWSQNLTKKVKRRTSNWREDIDLFIELDQKIRETDANFGQWKEDLEIFDYCISKYDPNRNFQFVVGNTPKLKKDVTEYIITKSYQTYKNDLPHLKISLQDTNEEVLSAINRPSVSWEKITEMVTNLQKNLPVEKSSYIGMELIAGLPGQTLDHIVENFVKIYSLKITNVLLHDYYYLKNSPSADPMYRKLWGIELIPAYFLSRTSDNVQHMFYSESLENFYYEVGKTHKYLHLTEHFTTIYRTKHMNEVELIAAKLLLHYYRKFLKVNEYQNVSNFKYNETQLRQYLERMKKVALINAEKQLNLHYSSIDKYGYFIFGKWDDNLKIFNSKVYG